MKKYKKITLISILSVVILFAMICNVNATTIKSTTDNLNFRKEPSTDSEVIMAMQDGEESELIEELSDWYKVEYKGLTGYVSKQYSKKVGGETTTSTTTTTTGNEETVVKEQTTTVTKTTITKDTKVKIQPLIGSSNILDLKSGKNVTVITKTGSWVYIQTSEISGWVREDCISSKTETVEPNNNNEENQNENSNTNKFEQRTAYVNEAYVNVRKKATTDSDVIKTLALNTEVTLIGEDGDWYKVKSGNDEGYIAKHLVSDEKQEVTSRNAEPRTAENEKVETPAEPKTEEPAVVEETEPKTSDSSTSKCEQLVAYAKQYLGCPYVYAAAGPNSFDCSGFTMYVYEHFGVSLPHGATSQSYYGTVVNASKSELLEKLKIGDLVFFLDYETYDGIGHVGIYIGNGEFIHASSGSGYCVKISTLLEGNYYDRYYTARRMF